MVVNTGNSRCRGRRIKSSKPTGTKVARLYGKTKRGWSWEVGLKVAEHLHAMFEALSSIPSTGGKKTKK
jgi:hypothetical protein